MIQINQNQIKSTNPRIALIGCGAIAEEYYLPALTRHKEICDQMTLVDLNLNRVQELAAKYSIKGCSADYRQVIDEIDGAIIALPTHLHNPVALELIKKGKHILCEKPLAESGEKAAELVDQAQRSGVSLGVNYLQRLIPSFAKVKDLLDRKTFGEPVSICYYVGEEFTWPTLSGFYFNAPISSRGILRDRGAHAIDHICWWLGGKPSLVSSLNDSYGGSETAAAVKFSYGNCSGEVRLNWVTSIPCVYTITCQSGVITGEVYDYFSLNTRTTTGQEQRINLHATIKSKVDIAETILVNFVSTLTKGTQPLISGKEVLNSIQFIDECYQGATQFEMPWYTTLEAQHAE